MRKNSKKATIPQIVNNEKFELPPQFLNMLDEFNGGGYLLFLKDTMGRTTVHSKYDDALHQLGMLCFAKNYLKVHKKISKRHTKAAILNNLEDGDALV